MPLFTALQAIVIPVRHMGASQRFYGQTLGLTPLLEMDGVSIYSTGNSELCLMALEADSQPAPAPGPYPNLRSADAAVTRATLIERGVECTAITQSGPVSWFTFHDPDGHRIDCCQYAGAAY